MGLGLSAGAGIPDDGGARRLEAERGERACAARVKDRGRGDACVRGLWGHRLPRTQVDATRVCRGRGPRRRRNAASVRGAREPARIRAFGDSSDPSHSRRHVLQSPVTATVTATVG